MFPGYSVSSYGSVRNDDTGHHMAVCMNQRGIPHVGLTRNRVQHKRALSILVAEAFIPQPNLEYDTPINLDGDRSNNSADNLLWRPRWHAVKYFHQFQQSSMCISRPVENIDTGELFQNSWHATTALGVLDRDIAFSIMSGSRVRIIGQRFRVLY